jgi:SSS family solute:Na+ symporter
MITSFIIAGTIYLGILIFLARRTRLKEKTTKSYLLAGGNLGMVLGLFTTAATIFSAFTVIGMPNFFRIHGIGSWIFLAVADAMMVYLLIRVGMAIRTKARASEYKGMAGLLVNAYGHKFVGIIALVGVVVFLIPYISVQIIGVSTFLGAAFPGTLPHWAWKSIIVTIMIIYSEVGGLRAIMYNDTLQGIVLFIVIWVIGLNCIDEFGSVASMFEKVESINAALLSVPGPNGLFTTQFFILSAISIAILPFTQPQISTRIIIMKSNAALRRMAIGLGIFAVLVILPTLFMGLYGAILYPDLPRDEFIGHVLLYDQAPAIAALGLIGLIAAAISTSDSQIFALGTELRSLLKADDQKALAITRIFILVFGVAALVFSILSIKQLVPLALTSFSGTALLAPLILVGLLSDKKPGLLIPVATLVALIIFISSLVNLIPSFFGTVDIRMVLFASLALITLIELVRLRLAK